MTPRPVTVVPPATSSPLEHQVAGFLAEKRAKGLSPATRRMYADVLDEVLLPYCRREGITEPQQITKAVLNQLSAALLDGSRTRSGKALSKASVASYARTINVFLGWLERAGEAGSARVEKPRPTKKVIETLSRADIKALEDGAATERDKLIVRILGDSGMRISEMLGMSTDAVQERPGRRWFLKVLGKGDKERLVPIQPGFATRLQRYIHRTRKCAPSDVIFLGNRRSPRTGCYEPFTASGAEQMIHDLGETVLHRRVYPHLFRHSFITECARQGMPQTVCAQIVGHENLAMIHEIYTHLNESDAHEAMMAALSKADTRSRS